MYTHNKRENDNKVLSVLFIPTHICG